MEKAVCWRVVVSKAYSKRPGQLEREAHADIRSALIEGLIQLDELAKGFEDILDMEREGARVDYLEAAIIEFRTQFKRWPRAPDKWIYNMISNRR